MNGHFTKRDLEAIGDTRYNLSLLHDLVLTADEDGLESLNSQCDIDTMLNVIASVKNDLRALSKWLEGGLR